MSALQITDPASNTQPKPRLDYLDGFRALAALYVLVHHVFLNLYPVFWRPAVRSEYLGSPWFDVTGWILFGHFGVDAFIVLSGFCLMLPVVRTGKLPGGALGFYARRARRILPTYYAAIAFCGLIAYFGHIGNISLRAILLHVALVNDLLDNQQINAAFWSIAVETHIYILFPLILWAYTRFNRIAVVVVTVAVSLAVYLKGWGHIPWEVSPHYLGLFAIGTLAATIAYGQNDTQIAFRQRVYWDVAAVIANVAIVGLSVHYFNEVTTGQAVTGIIDVAVGLAVSLTLIAASQSETSLLRRALQWKPLVAVGGFSYSLYLVHGPILQLFRSWMPATLTHSTSLLMWFAVTPLTVAISYLFYLACERPILTANAARKSRAVIPSVVVAEA